MCFRSSDWGGHCGLAGHQVTLLANSHFEAIIRESELDFVELGTEADYQSITREPLALEARFPASG